ncbi:hypothetical protein BaRGS_00034210 [Batillaria attramentaria]|uniref:Glycoside hydrolase family 49 N-terminal domain-containing protein n=1 Tax=Batillaria attramentaria TaxID=370345 RepID=A0ABD0JII8_9CAEN
MATTGILALAALLLPLVTSELVVYPSAHGTPISTLFQVWVSQGSVRHKSPAYITKSNDRRPDAPDKVMANRTMSWTSFAFSGAPVTVEIDAPHDFQRCLVRPLSYGFSCTRSGSKRASISVTSNTKMFSVEFDYDYGDFFNDIRDRLLVFADPPETHRPSKTDSKVLYYDVGVHELNGQLHLAAGIEEVYLAPGAWVKGGFITTQDHPVIIHGRGVVDNTDYPWHDHRFVFGMIDMDKGHDHTLEGLTLVNSEAFYVRAQAENVTIRNVKTLGAWIPNNDGFVTGKSGVIEDCFVHADDDGIKLYNSNTRVSRVVMWQGPNGSLLQAGWTVKHDTHHVRVTDVDVIHTDWCSKNRAIFSLVGEQIHLNISDFELRNVRVEHSVPMVINIYLWNETTTGSVSDIRLINWSVEGKDVDERHHSLISTAGPVSVSNIQFTDLVMDGQCVTNAQEADMVITVRSVSDVQFHCGSGGLVG